MATPTVPTGEDPRAFVASTEPASRRDEAERLLALFADATGAKPFMYGPTIVGFGSYTYRYPSGRTGQGIRVGFSPRKAAISLYGLKDCADPEAALPALGKYTEGAGCVYVKKLSDIDESVLRELLASSFAAPREHEV